MPQKKASKAMILTVGAVKSYMLRKGKKLYKASPASPIPKAAFDCINAPKSEYFTVGFAKTDVMPDDIPKKKYYVAGYSAWNPAKEVLDPMTASAIYIDDNSGRGGVVFVSVDSVGLSSYDVKIARDNLVGFVKETGCRSVNVMTTHNHAGIDTIGMWGPIPKSGRDKKYMDILHKGIVKVVKEAYANRKDGSIYYGKKETPEIQRDSRLPHVFCNELYRLRFVPADGSREVWLLNYSSHTESMLGRPIVSADFACYMRRGIEEMAGADSIYFVSSVGGLIRLKELDKDPVESTVMGGKALAETAVAIEDERKLEPVVNMLRQEYYSDADNFLLMTICQLGLVKNENRYATGSGTLGIALKTEMTYFEIGDLKLLLLPGELFPELAIGGYLPAEESAEGKGPEINPEPLCEIAGNRELMIFGLANDFTGYVVPPNDYFLHSETPFIEQGRDRFDRGHYEETNSLGPNTAHAIANTFKGIMKTVGETKSKR